MPSAFNLDRRGFLSLSLAGLSGIVWSAALEFPRSGPSESDTRKRIRREYGTLDQPVYRIDESLEFADFSSFRKPFKLAPRHRSIKEVSEAKNSFNELVERLSALELSVARGQADLSEKSLIEELYQISKDESVLSAKFKDILCEANPEWMASLRSLILACETESSILTQKTEWDEIFFQSIEATTRCLIKDLTGRELPNSVTFKFSGLADSRMSGASFFQTGEIIARPSSRAHLILTFCHEAGHLIAQHQEEVHFCPQDSISQECAAHREEACAYAFQFCAAAFLAASNPELAADVERISRVTHYNMLYDAYLGRQSMPIHSNGMVIFDAAWEVLGGPARAFNFLASRGELTKEMADVIAHNSELARSSIMAEPYMRERDMLAKIVSSLRHKVRHLRSRLVKR
jgi:hypothetical protein